MCCVCTVRVDISKISKREQNKRITVFWINKKKTYEPYDFANAYIQKYAQAQKLID